MWLRDAKGNIKVHITLQTPAGAIPQPEAEQGAPDATLPKARTKREGTAKGRRLGRFTPLRVTGTSMFQDGKYISGPTRAVYTYRHVFGARGHAMVLRLNPIDLSKAVDIRLGIKVSVPIISPTLVLRDKGDSISATIPLEKYATAPLSADKFVTVTIPAKVFKTKGWNMGKVRLAFVGFDPKRKDKSDCTVSVKDICAGFQ